MTYMDLYVQLGELTLEQLKQEVKTLGLDRPGAKISELWVVEEDQINPSGEGIEPKSVYIDNPEALECLEGTLDEEPVVVPAGTVLLYEMDAGQPVKAGPELGEEITISKQSWQAMHDRGAQS